MNKGYISLRKNIHAKQREGTREIMKKKDYAISQLFTFYVYLENNTHFGEFFAKLKVI